MKSRSRAITVLLLLAVLPLAAVACGGGGGSGGDAAHNLTAEQLGAMVLSKEELGETFTQLELLAEESGPQPNDKFLESFQDESEGQGFIDEFGRVTGYEQVYQGPALVAQSLTLYETADGAGAAIDSLLEDAGQQSGIELVEFDAGTIGDESQAVVMRQAGTALSALVFFRIEEIEALVVVTVSEGSPLADEAALQSDVSDLAQRLDDKIEAALEG
jgi:hypothetical protein